MIFEAKSSLKEKNKLVRRYTISYIAMHLCDFAAFVVSVALFKTTSTSSEATILNFEPKVQTRAFVQFPWRLGTKDLHRLVFCVQTTRKFERNLAVKFEQAKLVAS